MTYEANSQQKIVSFNDLKAWQEAHVLVLLIYKNTEMFPDKEKFGLTNQMRRASISVTSNIAEGFGRQTFKEKVQFYYHSNGSLLEIKSQLFATRDLTFITPAIFNVIIKQADVAQSLLRGLIRSAHSKIKD
jgi:four helix bundle protein